MSLRPIGWVIAVARAGPDDSPTAAMNQQEPDLAQRGARAGRQAPDDRSGPFPPAEQDADHERARGDPEREADRPDGDRDESDEEPEREPQPEANRVHLAELPFGVAEEAGQFRHPPARDHDAQPVAQLHVQVVLGQQVPVAAAHPGDHSAELPGDVEVGDAVTGQPRVRQQHPPVVDVPAVVGEVFVGPGPEELDRPGHRGFRSDHDQPITGLDDLLPWRRWTLLAMLAHALLAVITAAERAHAGLIDLTCAEVRRLLAAALAPLAAPVDALAHAADWSRWRRGHQHHAKTCHYARYDVRLS
jgi:hypothetical protein